jgi:hypothetical protein
LDRLVTRWGADPVSGNRFIEREPTIDDLVGANPFPGELVPEEDTTARVSVAAYRPEFDDDRKLWYVDVVFTDDAFQQIKSCSPFVRLALARLQPWSEPNKELSPIVTADFAQLYSDRWVTVMRDHADSSGMTLRVHVYGEGRARAAKHLKSQIEARIYRPSSGFHVRDPLWEEDPSVTVCSKEGTPVEGVKTPLREILLKRTSPTFHPRRLIVMEHEMHRIDGSEDLPRGGRLIYANVLEL